MSNDEPENEAEASGTGADAAVSSSSSPQGSVSPAHVGRRTRISAFWIALVVSLVVLVLLIVFVLENGRDARVSYFGAHADLPLGVALLLGAVIGGLVVALAGAARILQLRARARRLRRDVQATQ